MERTRSRVLQHGINGNEYRKIYVLSKTQIKEFISRPNPKDFVDGVGYKNGQIDQMLLNWWVKKESIPNKKS